MCPNTPPLDPSNMEGGLLNSPNAEWIFNPNYSFFEKIVILIYCIFFVTLLSVNFGHTSHNNSFEIVYISDIE